MASKLQPLQARRAALHHKVESHRSAAIRLFERASAELTKSVDADTAMALLDREINAIVDTSLNNMAVVHKELHS
jgi:hypothetical protein